MKGMKGILMGALFVAIGVLVYNKIQDKLP